MDEEQRGSQRHVTTLSPSTFLHLHPCPSPLHCFSLLLSTNTKGPSSWLRGKGVTTITDFNTKFLQHLGVLNCPKTIEWSPSWLIRLAIQQNIELSYQYHIRHGQGRYNSTKLYQSQPRFEPCIYHSFFSFFLCIFFLLKLYVWSH